MDYLQGIGANFVGMKNLAGANNTVQKEEPKIAADKTPQAISVAKTQKNANEILNSMHQIGIQNLVSTKVNLTKNDPKMAQRIGDFMANFEAEVQKGLQIIAKDFPSMDATTAAAVAAKAVLRAADLDD